MYDTLSIEINNFQGNHDTAVELAVTEGTTWFSVDESELCIDVYAEKEPLDLYKVTITVRVKDEEDQDETEEDNNEDQLLMGIETADPAIFIPEPLSEPPF